MHHCLHVDVTNFRNYLINLILDPLPHHGAFFGTGSGPIFLDDVVCRGTESSLLQCNTKPIGQHDCNHSEDAGVRCEGIYPTQCT